jgi:miniconductance mechanosensitive channel
MALLILVFRDTLLSFVASLQIRSNDLVREGDWIEMPAFGADGSVANIALHTVSIQNWDKTITVVPTYKLMDTPYKNWRGMEESGGRRIKRAIFIDLNTVRFCDTKMLNRFAQMPLVRDYVAAWASVDEGPEDSADVSFDDPLATPRPTNVGVFQACATSYLKSRPDLHVDDMPLLVRQLEPGPGGLPLEVYAFAKTTDWGEYESIQASIVEHLVAAVPLFGLRIFQQPSGVDFRAFIERNAGEVAGSAVS